MSLEQINDELRLLDKEHKVSVLIDFYQSVKILMDAKKIETCSLFFYDNNDIFDVTEVFLIEYKNTKGKKTTENLNLAMEELGISKIDIGYISPCFETQNFLKFVKSISIDKEQTLDVFMENFVSPDYSKIYLTQKLEENLEVKTTKSIRIKV